MIESSMLQLRPNFADAWSNLASAYMRKGRFNEAAQCCRQALALNPRLVEFFLAAFVFYDLSAHMKYTPSHYCRLMHTVILGI